MLAGLGGVVDDLECELEALEESDSIFLDKMWRDCHFLLFNLTLGIVMRCNKKEKE